jgi:hypothetical protein
VPSLNPIDEVPGDAPEMPWGDIAKEVALQSAPLVAGQLIGGPLAARGASFLLPEASTVPSLAAGAYRVMRGMAIPTARATGAAVGGAAAAPIAGVDPLTEAKAQGGASLMGDAVGGVLGWMTGASRARVLDNAFKRVREGMGGIPAKAPANVLSEYDVGAAIRRGAQDLRGVRRGQAGAALDAAESPIMDVPIESADLLDSMKTAIDADPARRLAQPTLRRLRSMRIKEVGPDGKPKLTTQILGQNLRAVAKEVGDDIRVNPPRKTGDASSLRSEIQDTLMGAMSPPEREAFLSALGNYKSSYADVFKNAGGAGRDILAVPETKAASVIGRVLNGKGGALLNPPYARQLLDMVGGDRTKLIPAVVETKLLKGGIENLPKNLATLNENALRTLIGAGNADALGIIADQVRRAPSSLGSTLFTYVPGMIRWRIAAGESLRPLALVVGKAVTGNVGPFNAMRMAMGATAQAAVSGGDSGEEPESPGAQWGIKK